MNMPEGERNFGLRIKGVQRNIMGGEREDTKEMLRNTKEGIRWIRQIKDKRKKEDANEN